MKGMKSIVLTGGLMIKVEGEEAWAYLTHGKSDEYYDLRELLADLFNDGWSGVKITIERDRFWNIER